MNQFNIVFSPLFMIPFPDSSCYGPRFYIISTFMQMTSTSSIALYASNEIGLQVSIKTVISFNCRPTRLVGLCGK